MTERNHEGIGLFNRFSRSTSRVAGSTPAFLGAALVVVVWAVSGPVWGFSDTWQLVINTGTTIVTFLMVFLIQNTQNRDSTAIHIKLDALIDAIDEAREDFVDFENAPDDEIEAAVDEFRRRREEFVNGRAAAEDESSSGPAD
ncbi:MAG: low affinity iron permease family protein [Dehalococcoidia bacterium]